MCGHEWLLSAADEPAAGEAVIRDAVGNALADGDTGTVIKHLRVKGASGPISARSCAPGSTRCPDQCASTGSAAGSTSCTPDRSSSPHATAPTRKIPADHQNAVT